jgi:hypothetical protein
MDSNLIDQSLPVDLHNSSCIVFVGGNLESSQSGAPLFVLHDAGNERRPLRIQRPVMPLNVLKHSGMPVIRTLPFGNIQNGRGHGNIPASEHSAEIEITSEASGNCPLTYKIPYRRIFFRGFTTIVMQAVLIKDFSHGSTSPIVVFPSVQ